MKIRALIADIIRRWSFDVISFIVSLLFLFLLIYPLVVMFWQTLFVGGASRWRILFGTITDPDVLSVVGTTAVIVGSSAILALLITVCFAWLNERTDASLGWVSRILPFMPLLLPAIALSTGWFFLAHVRVGALNVAFRDLANLVGIHTWDESGPLNITTWQGLIFVYTLYLVPTAYLIVAASFQNMDPALEEASRVYGAGKWRTFWRIALPSILPGIAAAGLLVVIVGLSQFSIPATIGTSAKIDILVLRVVSLARNYPPRIEEAVVISGFVMIVVATLWLLQRRIAQRQRYSMIGGKSSRANVVRLGFWKWPARILMIGYLLATSLLPLLALFFVSLQNFWKPRPGWSDFSLDNFTALFAGRGMGGRALGNSLALGITGATIGIMLATLLMLFARQRKAGTMARIVDAATKAPGAIPHVVIGLALVIALSGSPFSLGGTLTLLLIAYLVVYLPQAAISAGAGIDQIGTDLTEASWVFGASRGRTFRSIILPLMRPSLAAGWALLFVVILGDLTVSALIAQGSNPVVGFVIYDIWDHGTFAQLSALATAVGFVSFLVVLPVVTLLSRSNSRGTGSGW